MTRRFAVVKAAFRRSGVLTAWRRPAGRARRARPARPAACCYRRGLAG